MTDQTAPVTPRTKRHNTHTPCCSIPSEHVWADPIRCLRDMETWPCATMIEEGPAEREAGSTDALRMDDDHEPHPCCRHPRCCPHALAASDAGRSVHDLPGHKAHECRICGNWTDAGPADGCECHGGTQVASCDHCVTLYDAGPAGINWPLVFKAFANAVGLGIVQESQNAIAAEYTRLSRESDR
jgi:hypothetical protein